MTRSMTFSAVCLTVIAALAAILGIFFRSPLERRAVWLAAGTAFVIQLVSFAAVRIATQKKNMLVGWAAGIGIRFAAFLVWGLAGVSQLQLPQGAALLSMAAFLFVTTVIEPLFLKT